MEPILLVVLVVALVAVAAYFVIARRPKLPELEEPPEAPRIEPKPKQALPARPPEKPAPAPAKPPAEKAPERPEAKPAPPPETKPKPAPEAKPAPPPEAKPKPVAPPPPPPPPSAKVEPRRAEPEPEPRVPEAKTPPPPPAKESVPPASARRRDVEGLRKGLTKVREKEGFFGRLKSLFTGKREIDPQIMEQMEEVLLTSDVGVKTTQALLARIRDSVERGDRSNGDRVWQALRDEATRVLSIGGGGITLSAKPTVVMVVGVNGAGKTTSIGKLATKLKAEGKKVVLAAGDTFRAAAVQQLEIWGKRVGCEVVSGKDGANPGAVIFDAIQRAKEIGADVVLADTAGRLHTKTNLMDELRKVARTMTKAMDGAPHETLLVLDATNGQNAMQQATLFREALPLSGIVLTKLDGTAKGGIILGICAELGVPVRYIGIGERAEDLREFDAEEFVEAMLGQTGESTDAAA